MTMRYRNLSVGDVDIAYREAGPHDAPVLLLLHSFPTSGHMFRDLMPAPSKQYRVIALDLPGFGKACAPLPGTFEYTFDNLANIVGGFVEALELNRYALYIFDYGAPVGPRLAMKYPGRFTAIVTQNGNAYEEGLSDQWGPWQTYWHNPTNANREACRGSFSGDAIRSQYLHRAPMERVCPDGHTLDVHYMECEGAEEIQLDLILSYQTNVALYPQFQRYFCDHRSLSSPFGVNTTKRSSRLVQRRIAVTILRRSAPTQHWTLRARKTPCRDRDTDAWVLATASVRVGG